MSRLVRYIVFGLVIVVLIGLILPLIMRSRERSDRVSCQNHLRVIGFVGVRHASAPGEALSTRPREEVPPGTFLNPDLPPDERMSWYAYLLNVLNEGPPTPDPESKFNRAVGLGDILRGFDAKGRWDSPNNAAIASYRLSVAICPTQVRDYAASEPVPTNYVANGGLGVNTPALPPKEAGKQAGAFWYDGATPLSLISDGQSQTAQIIETSFETGPWLRGGSSTLRGLDVASEPYFGSGRAFGGCHPAGCFVSMVDGSVRFVRETIEPAVFRAMLTRAGGLDESNFESP